MQSLLSKLMIIVAIAALPSSVRGMGWIMAEQHEITSGEFRGFVIGSSKDVAAENLLKLGGKDLMAAPLPHDLVFPIEDRSAAIASLASRNG